MAFVVYQRAVLTRRLARYCVDMNAAYIACMAVASLTSVVRRRAGAHSSQSLVVVYLADMGMQTPLEQISFFSFASIKSSKFILKAIFKLSGPENINLSILQRFISIDTFKASRRCAEIRTVHGFLVNHTTTCFLAIPSNRS